MQYGSPALTSLSAEDQDIQRELSQLSPGRRAKVLGLGARIPVVGDDGSEVNPVMPTARTGDIGRVFSGSVLNLDDLDPLSRRGSASPAPSTPANVGLNTVLHQAQLENNSLSRPPPNVETVLVTNANGFIASHIVGELISKGYSVRITVPRERAQLCLASAGDCVFVDWQDDVDTVYQSALQDVTHVIHCHPTTGGVAAARRALVNLFRALANADHTVQRLVMCSSASAVHGHLAPPKESGFNELHWSDETGDVDTESAEKAKLEKEAWQLAEEWGGEFVVLVPAKMVVGRVEPALYGVEPVPLAAHIIYDLTQSAWWFPFVPRMAWSVVSITDFSKVAVEALISPRAALGKGQRYIVSDRCYSAAEIGKAIRTRLPNLPAPTHSSFDWITCLLVPLLNSAVTRSDLRARLSLPQELDASKAKRELGFAAKTTEESIGDVVEQLVALGEVSVPERPPPDCLRWTTLTAAGAVTLVIARWLWTHRRR